MIKIIQGTYGRKVDMFTELKTVSSEPFEDSAEIEKRLVNLGVAEYVESEGGATPPSDSSKPVYSQEMKLLELKEIALKGYNITAEELKKCNSKAAVIALIEAEKLAEETAAKLEALKIEAQDLEIDIDETDTLESLQAKIDAINDGDSDFESEGGGTPPLGDPSEAVQ